MAIARVSILRASKTNCCHKSLKDGKKATKQNTSVNPPGKAEYSQKVDKVFHMAAIT